MLKTYAFAYDYLLQKDVPDFIADAIAKEVANRDGYSYAGLKQLLNNCAEIWHMEKTASALDIIKERLI